MPNYGKESEFRIALGERGTLRIIVDSGPEDTRGITTAPVEKDPSISKPNTDGWIWVDELIPLMSGLVNFYDLGQYANGNNVYTEVVAPNFNDGTSPITAASPTMEQADEWLTGLQSIIFAIDPSELKTTFKKIIKGEVFERSISVGLNEGLFILGDVEESKWTPEGLKLTPGELSTLQVWGSLDSEHGTQQPLFPFGMLDFGPPPVVGSFWETKFTEEPDYSAPEVSPFNPKLGMNIFLVPDICFTYATVSNGTSLFDPEFNSQALNNIYGVFPRSLYDEFRTVDAMPLDDLRIRAMTDLFELLPGARAVQSDVDGIPPDGIVYAIPLSSFPLVGSSSHPLTFTLGSRFGGEFVPGAGPAGYLKAIIEQGGNFYYAWWIT